MPIHRFEKISRTRGLEATTALPAGRPVQKRPNGEAVEMNEGLEEEFQRKALLATR